MPFTDDRIDIWISSVDFNEEKHMLDLWMETFVGSMQPGLSCLTSCWKLMENFVKYYGPRTQTCGQRDGCDSIQMHLHWNAKCNPTRCLNSWRFRACMMAVRLSSSYFLPTLTAKNQIYEITACFVKNYDWIAKRKSEVLSLIGCSLYLFCLSLWLTRQHVSCRSHEQLKIIIKQFNLEAVSCLACSWEP